MSKNISLSEQGDFSFALTFSKKYLTDKETPDFLGHPVQDLSRLTFNGVFGLLSTTWTIAHLVLFPFSLFLLRFPYVCNLHSWTWTKIKGNIATSAFLFSNIFFPEKDSSSSASPQLLQIILQNLFPLKKESSPKDKTLKEIKKEIVSELLTDKVSLDSKAGKLPQQIEIKKKTLVRENGKISLCLEITNDHEITIDMSQLVESLNQAKLEYRKRHPSLSKEVEQLFEQIIQDMKSENPETICRHIKLVPTVAGDENEINTPSPGIALSKKNISKQIRQKVRTALLNLEIPFPSPFGKKGKKNSLKKSLDLSAKIDFQALLTKLKKLKNDLIKEDKAHSSQINTLFSLFVKEINTSQPRTLLHYAERIYKIFPYNFSFKERTKIRSFLQELYLSVSTYQKWKFIENKELKEFKSIFYSVGEEKGWEEKETTVFLENFNKVVETLNSRFKKESRKTNQKIFEYWERFLTQLLSAIENPTTSLEKTQNALTKISIALGLDKKKNQN